MPDNDVVAVAPQILQDLAPFLIVTAEETLTLVLETLTVLLKVEKGQWMTPDLAGSLTTALLDVWQKNVKGRPETKLFKCPTYMLFRSRAAFRSHRRVRVPRCCIISNDCVACSTTPNKCSRLCIQ